ncbi:MAG: hypothetical protein QOG01_4842 [Pseudonocardiales bacterium]|jgi:hypothetical protein|nr:hypothetical protein [Pseudonocardiales bacterium]
MSDDDATPGPEGAPRADFGDETRKLMAAVQEWTRRTFPEPPSGHPGPECQWCPLCQFASVMRGEHPEVTEKVAEAGAALAHAVKALVDSAVARAPGSAADGSGDASRGKPRPGPRVQHIRIDDAALPDDEI